ncbi:MAG: 2-oxo acid dehydrogenase subunit E2 [Comamonadaceae bacterium]|nr:MAG: 2-oxo acid dehydrogenase subunit E2 [Comamonadaceae bacterium]
MTPSSTAESSSTHGSPAQFRLPDVGEGLTEAEIVHWHVGVGDKVTLNDVIVEIETEKSVVELPSPYSGTVTDLLVAEGQTVAVGTPLVTIASGTEATDTSTPVPQEPDDRLGGEREQRPSVLVGYGPTEGSSRRRQRRLPSGNGIAATPNTDPAPLATPPVRKLAKDLGLAIGAISGSGPNGQITRDDVLRHAENPTAPIAVSETETQSAQAFDESPQREERVPIRGVRKHTAIAMVRSAFTAPQVSEFITFDITATMDLLARFKESAEFDGIKLTPLTLIAKALLCALNDNPSLNSSWDEEAQEIVVKHYVNLGIAAATPRGLVVPNIKNAERLNLRDLARAIQTLTVTAREGATTPGDLSRGTITITNVGVFGVDTGTPILNPGEAAILCVGAIRQRPWVVDNELSIRWVTTLSLTFDHRLADGAQGSQLLADVAKLLEDPLMLIALG